MLHLCGVRKMGKIAFLIFEIACQNNVFINLLSSSVPQTSLTEYLYLTVQSAQSRKHFFPHRPPFEKRLVVLYPVLTIHPC